MSMKHPGRCTPRARVSLSPSKIPYDGFSPVRLQTGRQVRPSASHALYALQATAAHPMAPKGRCASWVGRLSSGPPVQRPFARQRVVLSRSLKRYYGLICASRSLPPIYCLRRRVFACRPAPRGSPLYSTCVCQRAAFRTPADRAALAVPAPPIQAFVEFVTTQHPHFRALTGSCAIASRGCKVRFMLRPTGLLALHRPGLLHSSFHLRSHLPEMSSMTTRANSQFPAAGLAPATHAALWAASERTRIRRELSRMSCVCNQRTCTGRRARR